MIRRQINIIFSIYIPKRIKIAIIDDNEDFLFLTSKFLSKFNENLVVKTYLTPEKFLDDYFVKRNQFDAIISDFDMDNITGLDLLSLIRQISPKVLFILFTGVSIEELQTKATNLGADYCVIKQNNSKETYIKLNDYLIQQFNF